MFVIHQIPVADLRRFLPDAGHHVPRPAFPLVKAGEDFLRSTGLVADRMLGGVEGWAGEERYCRAKGVLRFVGNVHRWAWSEFYGNYLLRVVFRRFYSGGVVGRLELGLRLKNRSSSQLDAIRILTSLSSLQVQVAGSDGESTLLGCGGQVANALRRATTRHEAGAPLESQAWWLQSGEPLFVLESSSPIDLGRIPAPVVSGFESFGIRLRAARLRIDRRVVFLWLIETRTEHNRDFARRLRINLIRVHAEWQALWCVLNALNRGRLVLGEGSEANREIIDYLRTSSELLSQRKRFGIDQADLRSVAATATNEFRPGEWQTMAAEIRRLDIRTFGRIDRIVRDAAEASQMTQQHVKDARVDGDLIQVVNNYSYYGRTPHVEKNSSDRTESKQVAERVELRGGLRQQSDAGKTEQNIKDAKATEIDQTVRNLDQLRLGKYSASGKWAVVALVLVVTVAVVFKLLK